MPLLEPLVVAHRQRSRADERHLSPQHIDHVRHLVERVATEESPHGGYARIVADLEERSGRLVSKLERLLIGGCACPHRPKLPHRERLLAETYPGIRVEH